MSKDLKDDITQAVLDYSDNEKRKRPAGSEGPTKKTQVSISGGVQIVEVNIDKRKKVKILDSALEKLIDKIKPVAD